MAVAPTKSQLSTAGKSYVEPVLNPRQQKALLALAKIWELKQITTSTPNWTQTTATAMAAAQIATGGMDPGQHEGIKVGMHWSAVIAKDATAPKTVKEQLIAAKNLLAFSEHELSELNLVLDQMLVATYMA